MSNITRPLSSLVATSLIVDAAIGRKNDMVCESCGVAFSSRNVLLSDIVSDGLGAYGSRHQHRCKLHADALQSVPMARMIMNAALAQKHVLASRCPLISGGVDLEF